MIEKPLDRLNYFNGQRLEASDLKTEQDYHIRVRRWLNKSLYSPGIARGLEVRAVPNEPAVMVSPGLALDAQGREIILWEEQKVTISSEARHRPGNTEAEVGGLYLTIRYSEEVTGLEKDGCEAARGTTRGDHLAWGGPTRVRERALVEQRNFLPAETSGEVVLALVMLDSTCSQVEQIDASVRRYVGAASVSKIRQYALEGEREVAYIPGSNGSADVDNRARIYFHIRGRQPNSVTLYLRSDLLSTLYYTEMGHHQHGITVQAEVATSPPVYDPSHPEHYQHRHTLTTATISDESDHVHSEFNVAFVGAHSIDNNKALGVADLGIFPQANVPPVYNNILPVLSSPSRWLSGTGPLGAPGANGPPFTATIAGASKHNHFLTGETDDQTTKDDHTHTLTPSVQAGSAGVSEPIPVPPTYTARSGPPLTYVDHLEIWIGRSSNNNGATDNTLEILRQLADALPTDWKGKTRLGEGGSGGDILKEKGTGPIRLDFLPGIHFMEGEYYIELRVLPGLSGKPNGGKILYNLYIE